MDYSKPRLDAQALMIPIVMLLGVLDKYIG